MEKALIQIVKENIIASIEKTFAMTVYSEEVAQKERRPCFTVEVIQSEMKPLLGQRSEQRISFKIRYFSKNRVDGLEKSAEMGDKLYEVLAMIGSGENSFAASAMRHEFQDGQLYFYVTYYSHVVLKQEFEPMGTLEYNGKRVIGFGKYGRV